MKNIITWLVFVAFPYFVAGQHCLPEGITFSTQEQIDSFQVNYPGCHAIDGNVRIDGDDIVDLSGIAVIDSLLGHLVIDHNPLLQSLGGLENLSFIQGNLDIGYNASLNSLTGFSGLTQVGGRIQLFSNDLLIDLAGFQNLDTIFGGLDIQNCEGLKNLHGLENLSCCANLMSLFNNDSLSTFEHLESLSSAGHIAIMDNESLTSLEGLENLHKASGLILSNNPFLESLNGLQGLDSILPYGLEITYNESLTSLDGLEGLEYLRSGIIIESNEMLTSLTALEGLNDFGGELTIWYNNSLTSLDGVGNFNADSIWRISLFHNSNLCDCNQPSICGFILDPTGPISIWENAPGCDGPYEIADSCGFSLACLPYGSYFFADQEDIDSFAVHYSDCRHLMGFSQVRGENITNLLGLSNIESAETLEICGNPNLTSLSGLERLKTISGSLMIGYWECGGNNSLANLQGLDSLLYVGNDFTILGNNSMENLEGLLALDSVGGEFGIYENPSLPYLQGVSNLSSVGTMRVAGNENLVNLHGLESLEHVDYAVEIIYNPVLASLSGIDAVDPDQLEALWIEYNDSLSECDVYSICEFLSHPGAISTVSDNCTGCNSEAEILEECLVGYDEEAGLTVVPTFAPNPALENTRMSLVSTAAGHASFILSDLYGHRVKNIEMPVPSAGIYTITLNVHDLPAGIYFYSLRFNDKPITSGKLVVIQ